MRAHFDNHRVAVLAVAALGFASGACGDPAPEHDAGQDARVADAFEVPDAPASADAGSDAESRDAGSDAESRDAGSDAGPVARPNGFVSVQQAAAAPPFATTIFTGFRRDRAGCASSTHGPCEVSRCAPGVVLPPRASAGIVTVSSALRSAMLTPMADASYPVFSELTNFWTRSGTEVTVSAAGMADGVPAFSTSLASPVNLTLTAPIGPPSFPRNTDLSVTWTGGATGTRALVFISGNAAGDSLNISCQVPSEAGVLPVPSSALMMLDAGGTATIFIVAASNRTVDAGGFSIEASLETNVQQIPTTFD